MTDVLINLNTRGGAGLYDHVFQPQQVQQPQQPSTVDPVMGTPMDTVVPQQVQQTPSYFSVYADPNARVELQRTYEPPQWKDGETIRNRGSKSNSQKILGDTRFSEAVKRAGYSTSEWFSIPSYIKREFIKQYAEADYSLMKDEEKAKRGNVEQYVNQMMRDYGAHEDDDLDDGLLSHTADLGTELLAGGAEGIGGLVSLADAAQNAVGLDIDLGVQKALKTGADALHDVAGGEETESESEYYNYLMDQDRVGDAVTFLLQNPSLLVKELGPQVGNMVASLGGIGKGMKVAKGITKADQLPSAVLDALGVGRHGQKILNWIQNGASATENAGKVARIANLGRKVAIGGAEARVAASLSEVGGQRFEDYLSGVDVNSEDYEDAMWYMGLQQYITQGILPGAPESVLYKAMAGKGGQAAQKTINELRDYVQKADQGSILKRLNNFAQRKTYLGVPLRTAVSGAQGAADEYITSGFQDLVSQNVERIEDGSAQSGSMTFDTIMSGDTERAKNVAQKGAVLGGLLGVGAHPISGAGNKVRDYNTAREQVSDFDSRLSRLQGVINETDAITGEQTQSPSDIGQALERRREIKRELDNGNYENVQEYSDLASSLLVEVQNTVDEAQAGDVTYEQAVSLLQTADQHATTINEILSDVRRSQATQNTGMVGLQGQYNQLANRFKQAAKQAGYEVGGMDPEDTDVEGIFDMIRGAQDGESVVDLENRFKGLSASPMMSNPKYADMVKAIEDTLWFSRDPKAYLASQPMENHKTSEAMDADTRKRKHRNLKTEWNAIQSEFREEAKVLPQQLRDVMRDKVVDLDTADTALNKAITTLGEQAKLAEPNTADRLRALRWRLVETRAAISGLDSYEKMADARSRRALASMSARERQAREAAQAELAKRDSEQSKEQQQRADALVVSTFTDRIQKITSRKRDALVEDPVAVKDLKSVKTRAELQQALDDTINRYATALETAPTIQRPSLQAKLGELNEVRAQLASETVGTTPVENMVNTRTALLFGNDANRINQVVNTMAALDTKLKANGALRIDSADKDLLNAVENAYRRIELGLPTGSSVSSNINLNKVQSDLRSFLGNVLTGQETQPAPDTDLYKWLFDGMIDRAKGREKVEVAKELSERGKAANSRKAREQASDAGIDELLAQVAAQRNEGGQPEKKLQTAAREKLKREIPRSDDFVQTVDMTNPNEDPENLRRYVVEHGVVAGLEKIRSGFRPNDARGLVLDALVDLFDNSLPVRYEDLQGTNGYYDRVTGEVVLNQNSSEPDIDLVHELVHAYAAYAIDNEQVLTNTQRAALNNIRALYDVVKTDRALNAMNANLSDEASGIHEFVSEMGSNLAFQQRVELIMRGDQRGGLLRTVVDWFKNLGRLLGLQPRDTYNLKSLMTDVVSLFDKDNPTRDIEYQEGDDGVPVRLERKPYDNKKARHVSFTRRGQEQGTGVELAANAILDERTGRWGLYWLEGGQRMAKEGMTYPMLESYAQRTGLIPKYRSTKAPAQKWFDAVIEDTAVQSGAFLNVLNGVRKVLGDNVGQSVANALNTFVKWGVVNHNNRYAWVTAIENIGRNVFGAEVNQEVETRINTLKQKGSAQLEHYGVGGDNTLRDHIDTVTDIIRRSGIPREKIEDILYARRAPIFRARKLRATGKQDPYYKNRNLVNDQISGFGYYMVDGKWSYTGDPSQFVRDDDGSKFEAMLTPKEKAVADQLEAAIVAMNNNTLEFEKAMGRIDEDTFNDLYGEFYVPLMNADSEAKAFTGRAKGRHTKAGNLLEHYVANSKARINNAVESAIAREAADLLVQYPAPNIARIESSELRSRNDMAHAIYQAEGVMDGSSVSYFRDGRRERIVLTDPTFRAALAKQSKYNKDTMTSNALRVIGKLTRVLSLSRTVFSPTFHAVTLLRDAGLGTINYQAASRGKLSDSEARKLGAMHAVSMAKNIPYVVQNNSKGKSAHWKYKVFKSQGGINPMAHYDMESIVDDIGKMAYAQDALVSKAGKYGKSFMQFFHFSDDVGRMTAWENYLAMKHGKQFDSETELLDFIQSNPEVAAVARDISKNIGGNFEQKGASGAMRSLFMFWNASIGGMKTLYNLMNPKYGNTGWQGLLMMSVAYAALSAMGDEEDETGKPLWKATGERVGDVHIGGVRIPLPQEAYVPVNFFREVVRVTTGQQTVGGAVERMFQAFQESSFPFQTPDTDDTAFNLAYGFSPTLLQPLVSQVANKDWRGADLVREFGYDQEGNYIANPMDHQTGGPNNSAASILGTRWLAQATNGAVDVAPASVDLWFRHFIGGVGTYTTKVYNGVASGDGAAAAFNPFEDRFLVREPSMYGTKQDLDTEYRAFMKQQSLGRSLDELVNLESTAARKEVQTWYNRTTKAIREAKLPNGKGMGILLQEKSQLNLQLTPPMADLVRVNAEIEQLQKYQHELYQDALLEFRQMVGSYE